MFDVAASGYSLPLPDSTRNLLCETESISSRDTYDNDLIFWNQVNAVGGWECMLRTRFLLMSLLMLDCLKKDGVVGGLKSDCLQLV